jgi:hypothetical protein
MSSGTADEAADRALTAVARKLDRALSTEYTVNDVIAEATDPTNLACMFTGGRRAYSKGCGVDDVYVSDIHVQVGAHICRGSRRLCHSKYSIHISSLSPVLMSLSLCILASPKDSIIPKRRIDVE